MHDRSERKRSNKTSIPPSISIYLPIQQTLVPRCSPSRSPLSKQGNPLLSLSLSLSLSSQLAVTHMFLFACGLVCLCLSILPQNLLSLFLSLSLCPPLRSSIFFLFLFLFTRFVDRSQFCFPPF
ncbi:hypothetical protein F5X96DRAFT_501346 [Biscogniauxia mediterranea]|nr:hypothetical protein F5X96DRAFT_501346 [Biscogniauxia mediterranea]